MKMTLSILLITIGIGLNAQTFFFNQLVSIEKEVIDQKGNYQKSDIQRLVSSSNPSYSLEFKQDSISKLREFNKDRYHDFKILNYNSAGDLEMIYTRTCDESELITKNKESNKAYKNELIKIAEDEFEFNSYRTKNSKKPFRQIKIKMEESDKNQLEILSKLSEDLLMELSKQLDSSKSYTIKEISFWNDGKMHHSYRLKSLENARLKVILPSRLKFECIYPFLGIK